jgi:phosphoribosyl-AMP cyclohydrolase
MSSPEFLDQVRWNGDGLVPAVVQDARSGRVLMLAWMNREALLKTRQSGQVHFYSRSRQALWHKGATSGHTQQVVELSLDCDGDALLLRVRQNGGACHEGYLSCFFRAVDEGGTLIIADERVFEPESVYAPNA